MKQNKKGLALLLSLFFFVSGFFALKIVNNDKISFTYNSKAASTDNSIPVDAKFIFINHSQRELNDEEMDYISKNYKFVVFGNQNKPMTNETNRIKQINSNIKVLMYFPTSLRQNVSTNYGISEFKESWYLHDKSGNRILSSETLEYVDLTNEGYRNWAESKIDEFMSIAPYDGLFLDNANEIPMNKEWISKIDASKILSWNNSRILFVRYLNEKMNQKNKITLYNGLQLPGIFPNRSRALLPDTDGLLNERFCFEDYDAIGPFDKDMMIEDMKTQKEIVDSNKIILQKVNINKNMRERYSKYCYGIFLMSHSPGFSYFKFGEGYNLNRFPEEYKFFPEEMKIDFGNPITDNLMITSGIYEREFQNYWVVVNLNKFSISWENPDSGKTIQIPGEDAIFIRKGIQATPTESPIAQSSCRNYCKDSLNRVNGGWCAFKSENCSINGADYKQSGNNFCPSDRTYCCCRKN